VASSADETEPGHGGEDALASDLDRFVFMGIISGRRRGRGRVQGQEQAALRDAFVDQIEVSRIAVRILETRAMRGAAGSIRVGADDSREGSLRALPGGPRLALDEIDLLQFAGAGLIEIKGRRLPPLGADLVQIARHGRLRDFEKAGDRLLRPALQVHIRGLPSPLHRVHPVRRVFHPPLLPKVKQTKLECLTAC